MILLVVEQLRRRVPGGIGRYVTGLLQGLAELAEAGEVVPALTLYASRPRGRPDPLGVHGPLRTSWLPGPVLTRAWDLGLLRAPGAKALVHATSMAAPPTSAPLVVTVHDTAWRQVPDSFPPRGRRWHEASLRRARRRASMLVVPSEAVARDLTDAGVDPAMVVVIPLGADHLPAPDHARAGALLDRLGVGGEFLLSVGTLEPRKNLVGLLAGYERARPLLPEPWPLVVVGPRGWGTQPVSSSTAAGVVWAGPVDDTTLAALYARARLLAYVPLVEGFGLPPVEAMRQGTPVLATAMPSLGAAARVVDPARAVDIAAGLVEVATDDGLRRELVARGTARADELTWKASARAHRDLWASMTQSPVR